MRKMTATIRKYDLEGRVESATPPGQGYMARHAIEDAFDKMNVGPWSRLVIEVTAPPETWKNHRDGVDREGEPKEEAGEND